MEAYLHGGVADIIAKTSIERQCGPPVSEQPPVRSKSLFPSLRTYRVEAIESSDPDTQLFRNGTPAKPAGGQAGYLRSILGTPRRD